MLILFPTTHLNEKGFSIVTKTNNKIRNRLEILTTVRISLTKSIIKPRIDQIILDQQQQQSH